MQDVLLHSWMFVTVRKSFASTSADKCDLQRHAGHWLFGDRFDRVHPASSRLAPHHRVWCINHDFEHRRELRLVRDMRGLVDCFIWVAMLACEFVTSSLYMYWDNAAL
jgi:hypothetical protein